MNEKDNVPVCKACGTASKGKYCPNCGQIMAVKRLSLHELFHEAFHFFTHLLTSCMFTKIIKDKELQINFTLTLKRKQDDKDKQN